MAPDINLLPDEQRRAEQRELRGPKNGSGSPQYSQPGRVAPAVPVAPPAAAMPLPPAPVRPPVPVAPATPAGPDLTQRVKSIFGRWTKRATPPELPERSLDLNLIPQETSQPSLGQLWPLIAAVAGSAVALGLAYVGLGVGVSAQERRVTAAQDQAQATAERLLTHQETVAEMTQAVAQVNAARTLLDGHIYWTNFFAWLETVTLPDVYFSGFSGDVVGTFTLAASARDYVTLAQQLVALQADSAVRQVSVSEASRDGQGWVNFSLTFSVDPALLRSR